MSKNPTQNLDLDSFQTRLEGNRGRQFWKSLEELAQDDRFEDVLRQEFPQQAVALDAGVDRRDFLRLMGASLALAGAAGCNFPPAEKIIPYVKAPEQIIPGRPLYFATTMTVGESATGVLVESHMGRPTKIEGNPEHPASLGATDRHAQAAILGLYDPDRSQTVRRAGQIDTWSSFVTAMFTALKDHEPMGGEGVRILTPPVLSPTMANQIGKAAGRYPSLVWHQWDATHSSNGRNGRRIVLGRNADPVFHLDRADVILTLDADVLDEGPGHLRYARDFADRRRARDGASSMNRLYAVESFPSSTGAVADHTLSIRTGDLETLAAALATAAGVEGGIQSSANEHGDWIAAVSRDLRAHQGSGLVVAGEHLAPRVHAMVHRINEALGNIGTTVEYREPAAVRPVDYLESLRSLVSDMSAGRVSCLLILECNPVYETPTDLDFPGALEKVAFRAHLSPYYDETSERCDWHVPQTHFLESWSDARAWDGTLSIVQPLIEPLYRSRSAHEVISLLSEGIEVAPYDLVRSYWKSRSTSADFDRWWNRAVHDGVIPGDSVLSDSVHVPDTNVSGLPSGETGADGPPLGDGLEVVFRPDPNIHDGRFANNGWLQELPKPLTKLTWDNAILISPATAGKLALESEDVVDLEFRGRSVRGPIWLVPGHAEDAVTVHLGYGRTRAGRVGSGTGFDANRIRTVQAPVFGRGAQIRPVGERNPLACTQRHQSMEGRDLVRDLTFEEFVQGKGHHESPHGADISLYPEWKYEGYAWAMAIDTSICTGCNGCVVACVAENNIAVVGRKEVLREREMHWLRIDRYYSGDPSNPRTFHQPLPCMHCENAPCEPVCPVEATSHSHEGLNDMTYNRCVGTRYCSNNCPYKVRRFNFFQYSDFDTESLKLGRNPDVTVRQRGVMEKCSYCVQRINSARITAEKEGRKIRDGEIVTACQQACPTRAIVFGDKNDESSQVAKLRAQSHHYALLEELNTRPRTTYLATVRNPNPEIKAK